MEYFECLLSWTWGEKQVDRTQHEREGDSRVGRLESRVGKGGRRRAREHEEERNIDGERKGKKRKGKERVRNIEGGNGIKLGVRSTAMVPDR